MARIFITGSSDGLGQLAARILVEQRHAVVLHARDEARGREALAAVPGAAGVLHGDLSSLAETRGLAERANATDPFDAVIHNAAVGFRERRRIGTVDGLAHVFAVNTLAPYVLTTLMQRPRRLIYVSSELHRKGDAFLDDLNWDRRSWHGLQAYRDSKLHDVLLAFAVARRWPGVISHALEPGWMPTKMGGAHATGDLDAGSRTQVWLATSDDPAASESGGYWHHLRPARPSGATRDVDRQERLLAECARLSGVDLPHQ
ncbi:SDR family NAD(P)-dependent oxidoreductase [Belnapia sp. T18]|uniref:SDR family NAD(P)-dependent oxidoreductase n=1 Tax=Belnapia arida TaxID=2804533 RepID=A0ABS1UDT9_9PROT|nr:SDR family NAD(P)-dependent oxidoreductase [Belnapia arida]MBL6081832.1 SDR family NAD(P)-dependent oxidoreductase [Belnapia arida]